MELGVPTRLVLRGFASLSSIRPTKGERVGSQRSSESKVRVTQRKRERKGDIGGEKTEERLRKTKTWRKRHKKS